MIAMLVVEGNTYFLDSPTVGEYRYILEFLQAKADLERGYADRLRLILTYIVKVYNNKLTYNQLVYYLKQNKVNFYTVDGLEELVIDGEDWVVKVLAYGTYLINKRQDEINQVLRDYLPLHSDLGRSDVGLDELSAYELAIYNRQSLLKSYNSFIFGNAMAGSYLTLTDIDNLTMRDFLELTTISTLGEDDGNTKHITYDPDFEERLAKYRDVEWDFSDIEDLM